MIPRMCLWEGFAVPCVTAQLQLCQEWQRMTNPAGLEQKRGMLLEMCELQSWQWQPRAPQPSVSAWSTDIFTQGDANGIHPAQAPKLIFITVFLKGFSKCVVETDGFTSAVRAAFLLLCPAHQTPHFSSHLF